MHHTDPIKQGQAVGHPSLGPGSKGGEFPGSNKAIPGSITEVLGSEGAVNGSVVIVPGSEGGSHW